MNISNGSDNNNQSLNSNSSKKNNIGLIIGVIIIIAVIVFGIIFGGKFLSKDNSNNSKANSQEINYYSDKDNYIIEKVDIGSKKIIDIPNWDSLIVTDNNGTVVDITTNEESYNIQNNNYYYYVGLLEYFVNIESDFEKDNYNYDYTFRAKFKIFDIMKMLEKVQLDDKVKTTDVFKIVFDDILKGNLNDFILDFMQQNNVSVSELNSSNLTDFLLEKIQEKVELDYYGVKLMGLTLQSINENEIQKNNS